MQFSTTHLSTLALSILVLPTAIANPLDFLVARPTTTSPFPSSIPSSTASNAAVSSSSILPAVSSLNSATSASSSSTHSTYTAATATASVLTGSSGGSDTQGPQTGPNAAGHLRVEWAVSGLVVGGTVLVLGIL